MVESICIHLFSPNTEELLPFTTQSSTYLSFIYITKQGDKETGISIITLSDKQIDAGKCLFQKTLEIDPLMHYPQLATFLALEGGMAVMDTLYNIDTIKPMDQVRFIQDDDSLGRIASDASSQNQKGVVVCRFRFENGRGSVQFVPSVEL